MSIESPLIGSGSQEEVDLRVQALIDLGKSRGYLTYDELNERLPDEVVSPDKLDSLLMMIDEMGIKLIDEADVGEFQQKAQGQVGQLAARAASPAGSCRRARPGGTGRGRGRGNRPEPRRGAGRGVHQAHRRPGADVPHADGRDPAADARAGNRAGQEDRD